MKQPINILFAGYNVTGYDVLKESILANANYRVKAVLTLKDNNEFQDIYKSVYQLAVDNDIPVYTKNPKNINDIDIIFKDVDIIVSANYRYIFPGELLRKATLAAINIHGSYLPYYKGRSPNVWAIINGEDFAGVTVHQMVEEVDAGQIIIQKKIQICPEETGYSLLLKQLKQYPILISEALERVVSGKITVEFDNTDEGSYFPVRCPKDGVINWNSKSIVIYNWVRAQTDPYPGAFSYINGEKMYIWQTKVDDTISIGREYKPGQVVDIIKTEHNFKIIVATNDIHPLVLLNFNFDRQEINLHKFDCFI